MTRRRVFVTGMGLISPLGNEVGPAFERLCAGETGVRRVDGGSGLSGDNAIVAPVDFELGDAVPRVRARLMARVSQMAVLSTASALKSAGLTRGSDWEKNAGVYMGCGLGGSEAIVDHMSRYLAHPPQRPRAATVPMIMASGPASHISLEWGITGPSLTYSVACISSAVALGEAFRAIRDGYLDTAIAGGSEAQLNAATVSAWMALGALASEHADGAEASSRPFDAERTGLVLGEGAAVLVLESEGSVRERGATPLAEVIGFGLSSDAFNLTEPQKEGQALAIRRCLDDAGVEPRDIGYVNAHATATVTGDRAEWTAIEATFGEKAGSVPVSSTKGAHGHLIGATSAMEAVWTVEALRTGRIPPTANLTHPDPDCPLDCVPLVGRDVDGLRYALSNSFAFGGSNAAMVFGAARAS